MDKEIANNLLQKLEDAFKNERTSYQKIIAFILNHSQEVIYMNIVDLAKNCAVSSATICRFCRHFGFQNFNEFKLVLASSSSKNRVEPLAEEKKDIRDLSFTQMTEELFITNVKAMRESIDLLNQEETQEVARLMHKAKRIYFFGHGGSQIVALEAWSRLLTVCNNVFTVQDSHSQVLASSLLEEGDVIIYISYSGSTSEAESILKPAKERGAKIILISHHLYSPASQYADHILLCGSNEGPLQVGSISARIAMLFVVDILIHSYSSINPEQIEENKKRSLTALRSRHI